MTDEEIKKLVGKNIAYYRIKNSMKQSELAQVLNYSDKSISKWECGDGIPDVIVLKRISEIFGISLNDFLDIEHKDFTPEKQKKHTIIPIMCVVLTFFVASIIFGLLNIIDAYISVDYLIPWLTFVWAVPISSIILIIFSKIWWNRLTTAFLVSFLTWTLAASAYLTFTLGYPIHKIVLVFLVSAFFQILVILWFVMKGKKETKLSQ